MPGSCSARRCIFFFLASLYSPCQVRPRSHRSAPPAVTHGSVASGAKPRVSQGSDRRNSFRLSGLGEVRGRLGATPLTGR